jgi:uncharacterized protein YjbI with pentapeptide repeats
MRWRVLWFELQSFISGFKRETSWIPSPALIGTAFAAIALILSYLGYLHRHPNGFELDTFLEDFYANISTELGSIAVTVLFIDRVNSWRARREEKRRLILQMGSDNNTIAKEAVRQLRVQNWLTDNTLVKAELMTANLEGADLAQVNLRQSKLRSADLRKATLSKATLNDADFSQADLTGAILIDAMLVRTNLYLAKLESADLRYADLHDAILLEASLYHADLSEADLTGANLQNADLTGANLTHARISSAQLNVVRSLRGAIMPSGERHR